MKRVRTKEGGCLSLYVVAHNSNAIAQGAQQRVIEVIGSKELVFKALLKPIELKHNKSKGFEIEPLGVSG